MTLITILQGAGNGEIRLLLHGELGAIIIKLKSFPGYWIIRGSDFIKLSGHPVPIAWCSVKISGAS
jgi:hypothetical protein